MPYKAHPENNESNHHTQLYVETKHIGYEGLTDPGELQLDYNGGKCLHEVYPLAQNTPVNNMNMEQCLAKSLL